MASPLHTFIPFKSIPVGRSVEGRSVSEYVPFEMLRVRHHWRALAFFVPLVYNSRKFRMGG